MDELPTLTIDVGRLELALVNLLSNGIKYSDDAKPVRWVEISGLESADGRCQIAERDNGLGIPPDSVVRIFDRFTRAHAQREEVEHVGGLGLGLSMFNTPKVRGFPRGRRTGRIQPSAPSACRSRHGS
jgi:two-component system, OmpR family, sensor histidine kinase MtrB